MLSKKENKMSKYPNLSKISILYVEDDISTQMIFTKILKKFVHNVYAANNGKEGLEKFIKLQPDLIITDIQMPKMNGIEMIKNIRKKNKSIPIIITTAFNEMEYAIEAIKLKVDGFFLKPIDNIETYLDFLEEKAKFIITTKKNEKKDKIIKTIINYFDIVFFVENNKIITINEKANNLIKKKRIEEFLNEVTPKLPLKKIEKELIKYKNNFYTIKIDLYSKDKFIIIMNKLA
jgi:YesN/AraC family two-component response regulator